MGRLGSPRAEAGLERLGHEVLKGDEGQIPRDEGGQSLLSTAGTQGQAQETPVVAEVSGPLECVPDGIRTRVTGLKGRYNDVGPVRNGHETRFSGAAG